MQRMFLLDGQLFKVPSLTDRDRPPSEPRSTKSSTPDDSSDHAPTEDETGSTRSSNSISRAASTAGVIGGLSLLIVAGGLRRRMSLREQAQRIKPRVERPKSA